MKPLKPTEKFLPTRDIGTEPAFNSVRFLDVKSRIREPEATPPNPGLWKRLMARIK